MKFEEADIEEIVTVHSVNLKDYSQTELDTWKVSLGQNISFVTRVNDKVVGFSDMTLSGHLDRLYIHKNYQGQGIATAL
ncbi:GNAT family N-acetyltransferase [Lysinibacillus xylanilyticus]|uniref:GNAT family N-acetyltransferase n=1 Tax=Lysinibacillus xylanilyticus TaxID=582475 RepID=UPI00380E6561